VISAAVSVRSRIPQIIATGEERARRAVDRAANNVVSIAAQRSRYATGNMRGGWQKQEVTGVNGYAQAVFNNVHYAIYHEYGTIHMAAQPMLGPAIEIVRPLFMADIEDAYQ
jgi:HK97 gp10 family phage protein